MSRLKLILVVLALFSFTSIAYALPSTAVTYTPASIIPTINNSFDLGTSTAVFRNFYVTQICLSADCKTAWPSGGSAAFSFTPFSWGNATTTVLAFPGFISSASSTFSSLGTGGLAVNNGLLYNAATTTFNSPLNYSNGAVTLSTAGTWSGLAGTATALAADGSNCSAGSYPLGVDAAGAVQNCTVANLGTVTSVTGTWPILSSGGATPTISFGWSTTSQPSSSNLFVSNGASGFYGVATSSATINNGLTGTLTTLGSSQTIGLAALGSAGVLGAQTAVVPTVQATSTLYGTGTGGQVLGWNNTTGGLAFVATTSGAGATPGGSLGQLQWNSNSTFAGIATGTVSAGSSAITVTAGRFAVGGALAIDCTPATASQAGCLGTTDYGTFNAKQAPGFQIGTTSGLTAGNLAYFSTVTGTVLGGVATGTVSAGSSAITVTAGRSAIGGALAIDCAVATASQAGCLGITDYATFNGKSPWSYTINPATTFYGQVSNSTTTQMHYGAAGYSLTASTTAAFNKIEVGSTTLVSFAGAPLVIAGQSANYVQGVIQNKTSGANASAFLAVHTDIGTDLTYYGIFGCDNSAYSQVAFSSENQLDCFLTASDNALVIGTASSTNTLAGLRFVTGGTASSSIRMAISQNGYLTIGTSTTGALAQATIASSTAPQFSLASFIGSVNQWAFRALNNGDLAVATTTAAGTATSTGAIPFGISQNGEVTSSAISFATSTAMQIDWRNTPNQVEVQMLATAFTINIINATTSANWGSRKIIWVCNGASTAGAITWGGVEWINTAPTQTLTAKQCDIYSFDITAATSSPSAQTFKVAGSAGTGFQ